MKMRGRSNMLRYGRWMERKATMQVCGGRDEDTGLGLSFGYAGRIVFVAGGDVRVGRRAVSSDTARGVPRKRNVSGGCGGAGRAGHGWRRASPSSSSCGTCARRRRERPWPDQRYPALLASVGTRVRRSPPLRSPLSISIRLSAPRYRLHGRSKSAAGGVASCRPETSALRFEP